MAQQPTAPDEWLPIPGSSQFIDASSSTALVVPNIPAGQVPKGAVIVGILKALVVRQWLRYDGSTVVGSVSGGEYLDPGDFEVIYGVKALGAIRFIHDTAGGALSQRYYYFRAEPNYP